MADYIIRVFKGWNTTLIERSWSNSYEILGGPASVDLLVPIAEALVIAEKKLHLAQVNFMQYTVSTWVPDSHPYDPATFLTVPFHEIGERGGSAGELTGLDYNVCLVVKRGATTGRSGRLFYRGCLLETDVRMGGDGRFIIDPADTGALQAAFTAYQAPLATYLGSGETAKLGLIGKVKGAPGITTRRPVSALTLGGVTVNKRNHRYFDRM